LSRSASAHAPTVAFRDVECCHLIASVLWEYCRSRAGQLLAGHGNTECLAREAVYFVAGALSGAMPLVQLPAPASSVAPAPSPHDDALAAGHVSVGAGVAESWRRQQCLPSAYTDVCTCEPYVLHADGDAGNQHRAPGTGGDDAALTAVRDPLFCLAATHHAAVATGLPITAAAADVIAATLVTVASQAPVASATARDVNGAVRSPTVWTTPRPCAVPS
jgi:hypothetical protein